MPTTSLALARTADMRHKIRRGLVAYWPLASAGAVDLKSYVDGHNTLANNNTVARAAGPSSNLPDAADFTAASTQYLDIADNAALAPRGKMALACWVRLTDNTAARNVFAKYNTTGNQREFRLYFNNTSGHLNFAISSDGAAGTATEIVAVSSIQTDTWYFVQCTWDGAVMRAGNNLTTVTTAAKTGLFDGTSPFEVGRRIGAVEYWNGQIAGLCLWSGYVPSAAEFAWLYNNGQGRDLRRLA